MPSASDQLKDLQRRMKKAAQFGDGFDFILEEVPFRIIRRTLLGKDVNNSPLKELSPKYVEFRKKNKTLMGGDARPKKSNLTLTGQMLSSIIGLRAGNLFTFKFDNSFADQKAAWARLGGRPFFGLTSLDRKALEQKIAKILRENIRDLFKS